MIDANSPQGASFAFIRKILSQALDLIYPPVCVHCSRVGWYLCPVCEATLPTPLNLLHEGLSAPLFSLGPHTTVLRSAIHSLKYENITGIAIILGVRLGDYMQKEQPELLSKINMVIPVPLSTQRLKERGYNQAELIARHFAKHLGKPCWPQALHRHRSTRSQVGLSARQRQENVSDAFEVPQNALKHLSGRSILLVDDVCTTGATLRACASALDLAGVRQVSFATVSYAVH